MRARTTSGGRRKNSATRVAPPIQSSKKAARGARHRNKPSVCRKGRRNPEDGELEAAAELSEQFHGRPARKVREVTTVGQERSTLTELGALKELHVILPAAGRVYILHFSRGVLLASSPNGRQLYVVGDDQAFDPSEVGIEDADRDHLHIGEVWKIVYKTSKAFHSFEPVEYIHEFGEEGGSLPMLGYDTLSAKFYITGGSYEVRPEGIVN